MKYIYIILIILVLYYLISNLYQNFSSSEHFDPSLIPVSSIITLAKVSQKLVDGNGTLTNPNNLKIGVANAPGNLNVTGNTTLGLPDTTTNILGNTTINSNLNINGRVTLSQINGPEHDYARILFYKDGNNYYYSGPGNKHYFRPNKGGKDNLGAEVNINGTLNTKSLVASGVTNLNGNTLINPNLHVVGDLSTGEGKISINNGTINMISDGGGGLYLSKSSDMNGPGTTLNTGDTNIKGTLFVTNNANIGTNLNVSGDLGSEGNLNTSLLSKDDFMVLKMLLTLTRDMNPLKGVTSCTQTTPVILIDKWITDPDLIPYIPPQLGENQYNRPMFYIDNTGQLVLNDNSPKGINFVYIYPGYGMKGWNTTDVNTRNTTKPMVMENITSEILYYNLDSGIGSTDENIKNYGVRLQSPAGTRPSDIPNLWEDLQFYIIYKIG